VRDSYPHFAAGQQIELLFGPQGVTQQRAETKNWKLTDKQRNWTITVTTDSITLETQRYTSISEFASRMAEAVSAAQEALKIDVQERVGLRYVNEIRHPKVSKPSDWRKFMNPTLLGPVADDGFASSVESSIQELRLRFSDGSLVVRHGATRGTTIAPESGTSAPEGEFYLLDLDAFNEEEKDLDVDELSESMKRYNRSIYSLFRWGMNDQLFEFLKGTRNE
jgi:uncharacterized protein (TIGR04255 family)